MWRSDDIRKIGGTFSSAVEDMSAPFPVPSHVMTALSFSSPAAAQTTKERQCIQTDCLIHTKSQLPRNIDILKIPCALPFPLTLLTPSDRYTYLSTLSPQYPLDHPKIANSMTDTKNTLSQNYQNTCRIEPPPTPSPPVLLQLLLFRCFVITCQNIDETWKEKSQ